MTYTDTTISVALVTAKTKVAPLTPMTIPRLELCGARLLAKLLETTRETLDVSWYSVYARTDLSIVLSWLNSSPSRLKTYVMNRVTHILEIVPARLWRHVSTDDNPADVASRGMSPDVLYNFTLRWKGPTWLG